MKKLSANLGVKIVATVLFLLCATASLGGVAAIFYMADEGVYDRQDYSYYDSNACARVTWSYASDVYYNYLPLALAEKPTTEETFRLEQYAAAFSKENTNFFFTVTDEEGHTVLTNFADEAFGAKEVYTFDDLYDENGDLLDDSTDYTVTAYVKDPITADDDYYESYHFLTLLDSLRYTVIAIAVTAVLLTVLLFLFLLTAAGHRKNVDGISLNLFDRIPLDFLVCGLFLLAMVGVSPLSVFWNNVGFFGEVIYIIGALLICALMLLLFSMTFAARVKAGQWWQNTLIYKVGHALKKGAGTIFGSIPLLWKTVLGFCAYFFFNLICVTQAVYNGFFAMLCFAFNLAVLFGLCFFVLQLNQLKKGGERIAGGDFETKIDTSRLRWEIKKYAETLNDIGGGMSLAVEERLKSERLKAELITNVSHDIKTPLTSIINYVDLLKKEEMENDTAKEYIDVLDRQSTRLKKLTEDLVEASKAATGNIAFQPEGVDVAEFLNQLLAEYDEALQKQQLQPVVSVAGEARIFADGRLMWRVFDNLLNNICKYSLPHTRVYFNVKTGGETVVITLKNISATPLNITADDLMERFVRGDSARTTEGSGLGLSIAKSLTELQKGRFDLYVDGDLFKVVIVFEKA
ncbi:MAG TPA: HAMP domain-containing sensor histidine kinase [Clostridiales bacterium]|nr:HAMP domain-containing sensor histidine kinase [Clostridiales bacterium]